MTTLRIGTRTGVRGATLVELMMTLAISSVVILAATLAATSMFTMSQGSARQSTAEAQLALSLATIDRTLASTGAGYANARFAFRIRNNVGAGAMAGDASGVLVVDPTNVVTGANPGIIAGTDVIEVAWGDTTMRRPGSVTDGTLDQSDTTLNLLNADPLADTEWADVSHIATPFIMITRELNPRQSCLAKITGIASTAPRRLNIAMLNDDFTTIPAAVCAITANNNDVTVYKLEVRRRIFVYQRAGRTDLGLYVQSADPATGVFGGNIDALALGVDNLQVAPLLGSEFDGSAVTVGSCSAIDGGVCACGDRTSAPPCPVSTVGGLGGAAAVGPLNALVRGAVIQLTVRGERRAGAGDVASLDHAAIAADGIRRARGEITFNLYNAYLATQ